MANTRQGSQVPRGDVTGRQREDLSKEHAAEQAEAAQRMSIVSAETQEAHDKVIDLTDPNRPVFDGTDIPSDAERRKEEELPEVEVISEPGAPLVQHLIDRPDREKQKTLSFRDMSEEMKKEYLGQPIEVTAAVTQEDITMGVGNTITIVQGQRYKMPRWMVEHLDDKNMLYARA